MTVYLAGAEVGPFNKLDSSDIEQTTIFPYNSSFARCSVKLTDIVESIDLSLPDDFWMHMDFAYTGASSGSTTYAYPVIFQNGGTDVLRIETTKTAIRVAAWDGATWNVIISAISVDFNTKLQEIDLKVEGNNASGTLALYVGGTKRGEATGDLSLVTGIDKVVPDQASGASFCFSQFIIADEPTVGWRLTTMVIDGAGADSDFTGAYTYVDETVSNDTDYINSSTNGDVSTFAQSPVASLSGYTIKAVGVYCRAKCGATGPQNLQLALRSGGTNYFSDTKALDVGYDSYGYVWNTNPASAGAFLASEIDPLQIGVKAIT